MLLMGIRVRCLQLGHWAISLRAVARMYLLLRVEMFGVCFMLVFVDFGDLFEDFVNTFWVFVVVFGGCQVWSF